LSPRLWAGGVAAGLIVLAALASALWSRAGAVTSPASREIASGRQLYVTHCAVCHGAEGRGDGPSAAGFATKPSNLADGRLMNALPDAFLVNIILHGGPAEGLSPGMPPFGAYLGEAQARDLTAYLRSLADPPFRPEEARELVEVPGAPRQPIFFSHLIHAGSFRIDCRAARRRPALEYADCPRRSDAWAPQRSVPRTTRRRQIQRTPAANDPFGCLAVPNSPIRARHTSARVSRARAPRPIERMRVVGAQTGPRLLNDLANLVGLKPAPPPLSMGWCVDCHRRENAARATQAPLDCIACHH
jgi:mono/diheme cytochrome c family protein